MHSRHILFFFAIGLGAVSAAEPKRLYIANDDHTDYMWTADAETYAGAIALVNEFSLSSLTPFNKLEWV